MYKKISGCRGKPTPEAKKDLKKKEYLIHGICAVFSPWIWPDFLSWYLLFEPRDYVLIPGKQQFKNHFAVIYLLCLIIEMFYLIPSCLIFSVTFLNSSCSVFMTLV